MEKKVTIAKMAEPIHLRLPVGMMNSVRQIAIKDRRTIGQTIRILLEDAIEIKSKSILSK